MDREALVYVDLDGVPHLMGRLWARTRKNKESATFEYDKTWLENPARFSLEPAVQVGPGPFHTPADTPMFGAIGDSAPDRWGRALMRRMERKCAEREGGAPRTLQEAAATPFDDYFEFLVGEARREDLDGAPEGGSRYPVQARMDGRDFARFHVDVGVGDEVLEPLEVVTGEDWLGFGGVAPPSFPIISAEQQFAEKLHAYTLPRGERVNTRTKDLIDMVLFDQGRNARQKQNRCSGPCNVHETCDTDVTKELDPPPAEWEQVFDALAKECNLAMELPEGFELVREFTKTLET